MQMGRNFCTPTHVYKNTIKDKEQYIFLEYTHKRVLIDDFFSYLARVYVHST